MNGILVVDDEEDIRTMLRLMFEACGWKVDEAADGEEALGLFDADKYRVLVLDHRMPMVSGFDVARVLRGRGYLGPIIFFSACLDEQLTRRLEDEVNHDLTVIGKTDHERLLEAVAALAA